MIAALFVQTNGCYFGLPDVDPWDAARDARAYAGPHPVVAHPPCERWGRYAEGGPSHHGRFRRGDDGGCFESALASVRRFGGVLEHPAGSSAWATFGLVAPVPGAGWTAAGDMLGWTCCVEQGHYGHRARKPTWLYACRVELPSLPWGASEATIRPREGRDPREEQKRGAIERMSRRERAATPHAFRDLLIQMARSVARKEAA